MSGYPIQPGKAQPPALREETLARHRLLDWLDVKIHNRVVFIIADAGYGKTTLLADFTRRSRLRTLWYRMDEEDRNWVAFLSYLIAAGRVHDPDFAPRTFDLLQDTGPGGATLDDALTAFLRELPTIGQDGAVLILDDFHVAEDVPDIVTIARQLVAHAPERITLVFSSRRVPPIPVARLRALGEVAELRTSELRFSDSETEALFKDTYGRALEPDVLSDLSRRTDGWAASLYLVRAALRDRSAADTRAFVRGLTGAQTELHDYLAEEVIGDLAPDQQAFLMGASILQSVQPDAAAIASGLSPAKVLTCIQESERLGLLARRSGTAGIGHRFHPLVGEFLEARLRRELGDDGVNDLHLRIASWARTREWRTALYHFAAAGDSNGVRDVIEHSIDKIVGTGEIGLAAGYLRRFPKDDQTASAEIVWSRLAGIAGNLEACVDHALRAVALAPDWDLALGNLLSTYFVAGRQHLALGLAEQLAASATSTTLRLIGAATLSLVSASLDGKLDEAAQRLELVEAESRRLGLTHYEGVSLHNLAVVHRARGDAEKSMTYGRAALDTFARSFAVAETAATQLTMAWGYAHSGDLEVARSLTASAMESCTNASRLEWLVEVADIETMYGDDDAASLLVEEAAAAELNPSLTAMFQLTRAQLALRTGDLATASACLPPTPPSAPTLESGFLARYFALTAHLALRQRSADAAERIRTALAFAQRQGAGLWLGYCRALLLARDPSPAAVGRTSSEGSVFVSMAAEVFVDALGRLPDDVADIVAYEATRRPERWRSGIRRVVADPGSEGRLRAARILDVIGAREDVPMLRSVARAARSTKGASSLGRGLARRLADLVRVEDQGRVVIHVGKQVTPGADLRRKVLAMLCFLLTRPKYSATRDEVVDALWPDLAPEVAVNSLNQTVYFLRRVFEPSYKEEISAGYVRHDSDVLWLDDELITSRSRTCRELIDRLARAPSPEAVATLSESYLGRFALDFAYEEWAVPFRDSLHVAYIHVVESAVNSDIESGHYDRGIRLARRALDIDPELDGLEVSLLRMYRMSGAHSAAAEQYAHYAAYVRAELGEEPPPLESL